MESPDHKTLSVFLAELNVPVPAYLQRVLDKEDPVLPPLPHLEKFIRAYGVAALNLQPDSLRDIYKNYHGLAPMEKMVALKQFGVGAHVADVLSEPDLMHEVAEACAEIGWKRKFPRIIVIESDLAYAGGGTSGKDRSTIFVTTTLLRLLNPAQRKSLIGHELNHAEETAESRFGLVGHHVQSMVTFGRTAHKAELRSDARGAKTEGGAEAMISALETLSRHNEEIKSVMKLAITITRGVIQDTRASGGRIASAAAKLSELWVDKAARKMEKPSKSHPTLALRIQSLRGESSEPQR